MTLHRFRKERQAARLKPLLFENRPAFYPLITQLTSAAWNGDSYSTTAKTLIDLESVFGAPADLKAVLCKVGIRDSGSSTNDCYIILSPNDSTGAGMILRCSGLPDDTYSNDSMVVPCDANGDIYYQIAASGTTTADIFLEIWGYWI